MSKRFVLLLSLCSLFFLIALVGLNSLQVVYKIENDLVKTVEAQTGCGKCELKGRKKNKPANVESLTLSTDRITIPCPSSLKGTTCSDNWTISVSTKATDKDKKDILTYNYTVSGGRIIGSGANVTWDLSGVRPGTYTITAGADDGCGVCGMTKTETVTVEECNCTQPCVAPMANVTGSSEVAKAGEIITFTANVSGATQANITYNWTLSKGTIVAGQGTPSISVETAYLDGQAITATVEIGGINNCVGGAITDSETIEIKSKPQYSNFFGVIRVEVRGSTNQLLKTGVTVTIEATDPSYEIEPRSTSDNNNGIYEFGTLPAPVQYKITATRTIGTSKTTKTTTAVSNESGAPIPVVIKF
jgi:hypothetical protein